MKPFYILEVCEITPVSSWPESSTEPLSLPLTCFDTLWLKFHPVERLFFFTLTHVDLTLFKSVVLNKLKQSLSIALFHYLPLAGKLIWPSNADAPFIKYSVKDCVLVTVAQSNADFSTLSGLQTRKADDSGHCVPELPVTDSEASVIALQITLFPNQGFCIGISSHHAVLDGKSSVMFMKAWAHICKHLEEGTHQNLPPDLTPVFDRTIIRDPDGYKMKFLDIWLGHTSSRSLKLVSTSPPQPDKIRATFRLSREDIKKLREKVISELKNDSNDEQLVHLSTFVLTFAFTMVSILKAKEVEKKTLNFYVFTGDCRSRLENPLAHNYFGNCVTAAADMVGGAKENGIASAAKSLSSMVKSFQEEEVERRLQRTLEIGQKVLSPKDTREIVTEYVGVAGSPKFEVYGTDFGWGRPKMVEVTSVDRTSSFSLAESGDGSGGVEVGLALKEHEMETFQSFFTEGLN